MAIVPTTTPPTKSTLFPVAGDSLGSDSVTAHLPRGMRRSVWGLLVVCLLIEASFVLLDLTVNWWRWSETGAIRRMFNITREDGIASLFAVIQTFAIAAVLWLTWALVRATGVAGHVRLGWLLVAAFFTYLGIDDGALVHERIGTAFKKSNEDRELISYGWQMVMAPGFAIVGGAIFLFLWRQLSSGLCRALLFAGFSLLAVAMLIDFVEGMEDGYLWLIAETGWSNRTIRHFSKSLEEWMEMVAMTLLLTCFLLNLCGNLVRVRLSLEHGIPKVSGY